MKIWSDALSCLNVSGESYVNAVEKSLRGVYSDDDNGDCHSRVVESYDTTRYQDQDGDGGPEGDDRPDNDDGYVPEAYSNARTHFSLSQRGIPYRTQKTAKKENCPGSLYSLDNSLSL